MKSTRFVAMAAMIAVCLPVRAARFDDLLNGYRNLQLGPSAQVAQLAYSVGHMNVSAAVEADLKAHRDLFNQFFEKYYWGTAMPD